MPPAAHDRPNFGKEQHRQSPAERAKTLGLVPDSTRASMECPSNNPPGQIWGRSLKTNSSPACNVQWRIHARRRWGLAGFDPPTPEGKPRCVPGTLSPALHFAGWPRTPAAPPSPDGGPRPTGPSASHTLTAGRPPCHPRESRSDLPDRSLAA